MFRWRQRRPAEPPKPGRQARFGVEWAVTDRSGGVSTANAAEFNLGLGVPDAQECVMANRSLLAVELGVEPASLRFMQQQHGTEVVCVGSGPASVSTGAVASPACDALITQDARSALAVLVADCTPVLLFDPVAGWVGAVHAGRVGMTAGVVTATLSELAARGAGDLEALVGPAICGRCYEVPEQLRDEAAARCAASHAVSWSGTPAVDVAAGVVQQLHASGVPVHWLPGCTREAPDLYSHRRDRHTGRFAGVIRLVAPGADDHNG